MLLIRLFGRRLVSADVRDTIKTTLIRYTSSSSVPSSPSPSPPPTDNKLIVIQDSCLHRLKQLLQKPSEEYLRINVETGGCSGFSYIFDIENAKSLNAHEDLVFERDNYRVVINKEILPYMRGSKVEYHESLIKSSFQVVNPIAETKCSCGSSFSVDLSKLKEQ